ncbi:MAG: hypothetical protein ACLFP8_00130 [Alphaproteobacteria bacterium]
MYHKAKNILPVFLYFLLTLTVMTYAHPHLSYAQDHNGEKPCSAAQRDCLIDKMITLTAQIENTAWRDQTYREIAKTLAFDKKFDQAVALIDKIETPDTRAMTIRGIGMTLAEYENSTEDLARKFAKLHIKAGEILDPPSQGIAMTYIAMSQAFAKNYEGAWATCEKIKNTALRNKAYAETAEIQAEYGDFEPARKSINLIESTAFRNKAFEIISKILANNRHYEQSLKAAMSIANTYKQTQAIQYILDQQKPRERVRTLKP